MRFSPSILHLFPSSFHFSYSAAPGAQNGDAHCSHSDGKAGLWDSSSLQKKTIEILVALAQEISQFPNVVGLELLNEPKNGSHLQAFYDKAIPAIRNSGVKELPLYVGDGWTTEHYCNWLSNYKDDFVVVDYHLYRCFTPEDHKTASEVHAQNTREGGSTFNWLKSMAEKANQGNLIVGESPRLSKELYIVPEPLLLLYSALFE